MKPVITSVLVVMEPDKSYEIMLLLNQHKEDILKTRHFNEVSIVEYERPINFFGYLLKIYMLILVPKTQISLDRFNDTDRPALRAWFEENLVQTGLINVASSRITSIEESTGHH